MGTHLESSYDVVVLGSGIAGLSAALAAHESGLSAVLIEKTDRLGGTTSDSYGLIWVGDNHLMRRRGETDTREDIVGYMTFLGGGGGLMSLAFVILGDVDPYALSPDPKDGEDFLRALREFVEA